MAGAFVWLRAGALAAGLGALTQAGPATAPSASAAGAFDWRDAVLYFVVVDRFADGNPGNNVKVDRAAKGAFHGGDLVGLRERLDDIAELGVTALWITPVVKNIEGFVTGAGPTISRVPTLASAARRT